MELTYSSTLDIYDTLTTSMSASGLLKYNNR